MPLALPVLTKELPAKKSLAEPVAHIPRSSLWQRAEAGSERERNRMSVAPSLLKLLHEFQKRLMNLSASDVGIARFKQSFWAVMTGGKCQLFA